MQDSRLCIDFVIEEDGERTINWKFQEMTYHQIREVCKRIVQSVRSGVSGIGNLVALEHYPEDEEMKVCVVFLPIVGAIQVAVNGISLFDACILCDEVVWYIDHQILSGANVTAN